MRTLEIAILNFSLGVLCRITSAYPKVNTETTSSISQFNISQIFSNLTNGIEKVNNTCCNETLEALEIETYNISFWLENDYNKTIGPRKIEFENHLLDQLRNYEESYKLTQELNSSKVYLERLTVWPKRKIGRLQHSKNILVTAVLVKSTDDDKLFIDNFLHHLDQILQSENFTLTDMNNITLSIPKQRIGITVIGKKEDPVNSWLVLGIFLCILLIALLVAIHKHRKEKADSVRPIQGSASPDFRHSPHHEMSIISRLRAQQLEFSDNLNEEMVSRTRASSASTLSVIAVSLSDVGESILASSEINLIDPTGSRNYDNDIYVSQL